MAAFRLARKNLYLIWGAGLVALLIVVSFVGWDLWKAAGAYLIGCVISEIFGSKVE